jgi:hypothetical protein
VKVCPTCRCEAFRLIKGECKTCWTYRKRTGHQRPEALILAWGHRLVERRLTWSRS